MCIFVPCVINIVSLCRHLENVLPIIVTMRLTRTMDLVQGERL